MLGTGQELKANFMLAAYGRAGRDSATPIPISSTANWPPVSIFTIPTQDFTQESSYISATAQAHVAHQLRVAGTIAAHACITPFTRRRSAMCRIPRPTVHSRTGRHATSLPPSARRSTYDQRDNKLNPTERLYSPASPGSGGPRRRRRIIVKHEIKASYYYPIAPKWVLSFLGSGGYMIRLGGKDVRIEQPFLPGRRRSARLRTGRRRPARHPARATRWAATSLLRRHRRADISRSAYPTSWACPARCLRMPAACGTYRRPRAPRYSTAMRCALPAASAYCGRRRSARYASIYGKGSRQSSLKTSRKHSVSVRYPILTL